MLAPEFDDGAVDQHHLDPEEVVGGHTIFQTVGAAGIHADIAADGAGKLRTRIGRVEEAFGRNGLGNVDVGDARLHRRRAVGKIDIQNAVHLGETENDRVLLRDRPAGERRAGAARDDGDAVAVAVFQHGRHLLGGLRQCDGERHAAIGDEGIGLERHELARLMHQAFRR
jgi:hypothetical protein